MAQLTAAETHALSLIGGTNMANIIADACAAAGTAGQFDSVNGAAQIGSNTTDLITIKGLLLEQASNAVTAFATGGQTSATQLTSNINRISVCATAGDSVKLPLAAAGSTVIVINDGAAAAQVFGKTTDTINSIATATGVTLPAGAVAIFFATTTINWRATVISPPVITNTAISTAGAGTLSAAGIVGRLITRSGASAAYSDATDTAVAIVAAIPVVKAGMSFFFEVKNTVNFAETLTAAAGITLTGNVVIPALSVGRFLLTVTSVTAVAIVGVGSHPICNLPYSKFTTDATGTQTADAGDLTGAAFTVWKNTANGAVALTVRTAAQMLADIPNAQIGTSFHLRIISGGDNTVTLTADGGATVTITGTATAATGKFRDFIGTFMSATALTFQDIGGN